MDRTDGSHWFYSYLPQGVAGGATSTLIPLFAYALGGKLSDVGIIAAATSVASVPAFILWGSLSDRLGRRKVFLLIGFLGSGIASLAMGVSQTMSGFYLANLLAGFLGAASGPVGTVLLMETADRKEWPARLALVGRIGALGWVGGLALGVGWLVIGPQILGAEVASMRALFVIGAALGLLAGLLVQLWTIEPAVRVDRREVHLVDVHPRVEKGRFLPMRILYFISPTEHRAGVRLSRSLRIYLICVFLLFGGFTAFYGFFPIFLAQVYGFGSPEIFAVYIASQATSIAAYPRVGRWISARGDRSTQLYAALGRSVLFPSFLLVGLAALPQSSRLGIAFALHAGIGLCWAVINVAGSTLVSRLAPEDGRAEAFGTYNAVQGFGSILGPLVGGFTAEFLGYGPAVGVSVALVLAGSGLLAAARIPKG
jgi:MFS family permease